MCKTKKIIAGFLCAMAAGVGILSIMPQTAGAQTAASQGATATAGMSLEQLQQIIEMLKQQIQQIIVLLQQRIQLRQDCVGEGQTFTDANRQCCAGLEKQDIGTPCPDGQVCAQVISYKCVKPATLTCAEVCRAQGYADSKCSTYAVSPEGFANKCGAGNYILSGQSASDCQLETNSAGVPVVGAGKACCCAAQVPTCAGEGEKIYMSSLADGRPTQCCSGLTAISSCSAGGLCPNNGSSTCAYCGNGVCGTGENSYNCPADCGAVTCTDSDGGINYYVKGTAVQYSSSGSVSNRKTDTCYPYNPDLFDGAADSASAGHWLREVYCNGATLAYKVFECEYGCKDGACVREAVTCAKEGEIIYFGRPQCCDGLVAIGNGFPTDWGCNGIDNGSAYCANCGNGICGLGENECNCPKDCPIKSCAGEGKTISSTVKGLPSKCCAGLSAITNATYYSGGCMGPTLDISYCAQCGNGVCGAGENVCNCPQDCGQPIIKCYELGAVFPDSSRECCDGLVRTTTDIGLYKCLRHGDLD